MQMISFSHRWITTLFNLVRFLELYQNLYWFQQFHNTQEKEAVEHHQSAQKGSILNSILAELKQALFRIAELLPANRPHEQFSTRRAPASERVYLQL